MSLPTWDKPPDLLPERITFSCDSWEGRVRCSSRASVWVCHGSQFVGRYCDEHAALILGELNAEPEFAGWYVEPIHHDDPDPYKGIPRKPREATT